MGDGEELKTKVSEHKCKSSKIVIKNNASKKKKLFIISINKGSKRFFKQYYGKSKEKVEFKGCIENNVYIIKKVFFNN